MSPLTIGENDAADHLTFEPSCKDEMRVGQKNKLIYRWARRQSPGGSEQHLTRAAAAARTRTQRPGKHLAVHASELVVKPDFQILRRYRRPLLLRLEHTHRPTLEDYVHRAARLGSSRSLNLRIGIMTFPTRLCAIGGWRTRTSSTSAARSSSNMRWYSTAHR